MSLALAVYCGENKGHISLQSWPKIMAKTAKKTAFFLTPQAMYNQCKRSSAWSVSELYYICRKTLRFKT